MTKDEYKKLLIDSSFKEARLFWLRNSAFFVVESLILGFFINILLKKSQTNDVTLFLTILKIIGLVISIFYFIVILISKHYNLIWFNELKEMLATTSVYDEDEIDKRFYNVLTNYDNIIIPKLTIFKLIGLLSVLFIFFWIIVIVLVK